MARVSAGLLASAALEGLSVCVTQPTSPPRRQKDLDQPLADTLRALLASHPRVTLSAGEEWAVHFVRGDCPPLDEQRESASEQ